MYFQRSLVTLPLRHITNQTFTLVCRALDWILTGNKIIITVGLLLRPLICVEMLHLFLLYDALVMIGRS